MSQFIDLTAEEWWSVWQVIPCLIFLIIVLMLNVFWTHYMSRILLKSVVKKEEMTDARDEKNSTFKFDVQVIWQFVVSKSSDVFMSKHLYLFVIVSSILFKIF